jgi:hypothetical protein
VKDTPFTSGGKVSVRRQTFNPPLKSPICVI